MAGLLEYGTYSFLDVQATFSGPGGSFDLGGSGVAEEGVRFAQISDKDVMTIGANGNGMHSLSGSDAARCDISLLKTAPGNAVFGQLYNYQKGSSQYWGKNQLTINNPQTGDSVTLLGGAFVKVADNVYAMQANLLVWSFFFISRGDVFGNGGNPRALIVTASS